MKHRKTAYAFIRDIARKLQPEGYLVSFETDLTQHDRDSLRDHQGEFLWCIRKYGTHLSTPESHVDMQQAGWKGMDEVWRTFCTDRDQQREQYLAYHVVPNRFVKVGWTLKELRAEDVRGILERWEKEQRQAALGVAS